MCFHAGVPNPGPWPVRNRAAQQEVSKWSFIFGSPSLTLLPEPSPKPWLWKNRLPRNRSLVPKRLGTAAFMHTCVHTFPFSTLPSSQVPIINAPIFWTQLINQSLPSCFPLKTLTAFPLPSHCYPRLQLVPLPLTYSAIHPLHHCLSHCPKMPF